MRGCRCYCSFKLVAIGDCDPSLVMNYALKTLIIKSKETRYYREYAIMKL